MSMELLLSVSVLCLLSYGAGRHYQWVAFRPERRSHLELLVAATDLFHTRQGWADASKPYAPRRFWANLGEALYGIDDSRVKELQEPDMSGMVVEDPNELPTREELNRIVAEYIDIRNRNRM